MITIPNKFPLCKNLYAKLSNSIKIVKLINSLNGFFNLFQFIMSSDLTFITNEPENNLLERFKKLIIHTKQFDICTPSK
jgi:hypothetical protein